MERIVTIVATIRTTADDDRIRAVIANAFETPLEDYGAELVPCDWAPDVDTIADCIDNPDDLPVSVLDMNMPRAIRSHPDRFVGNNLDDPSLPFVLVDDGDGGLVSPELLAQERRTSWRASRGEKCAGRGGHGDPRCGRVLGHDGPCDWAD